MKRILITVCTLFVALSAPLSAEKVEGYLIDKACSAKVAKEGVDAAKTHTKDCALMPNCKDSGYGVVTADGKFLKFDKDGDRMAARMLDSRAKGQHEGNHQRRGQGRLNRRRSCQFH